MADGWKKLPEYDAHLHISRCINTFLHILSGMIFNSISTSPQEILDTFCHLGLTFSELLSPCER